MKLLVDGVFFQLAQSGIARVWRSLLPELYQKSDLELLVLDRGGLPELPGIKRVPFPSYTLSAYTANDSILLEEACRRWEADLFISTYFTTPLETPSVALVHDMIPELLGWDLTVRDWMEKEVMLSHARRHVCVSNQTRSDLLRLYPELDPRRVEVAYNGVDPNVFSLQSVSNESEARSRFSLERPFFVLVGSRNQHKNYKNARLFFEAVGRLKNFDFDILCVGGEPEIDESVRAELEGRCCLRRVDLTDNELAEVYRHAIALVYPSLYEGFGMPVIEAMACGCPVITTNQGALKESAGEAAITIDGYSVDEMAEALWKVRDPEIRDLLIARGVAQAARFRWSDSAEVLARACFDVAAELQLGTLEEFGKRWSKLRRLQAEVEVV